MALWAVACRVGLGVGVRRRSFELRDPTRAGAVKSAVKRPLRLHGPGARLRTLAHFPYMEMPPAGASLAKRVATLWLCDYMRAMRSISRLG